MKRTITAMFDTYRDAAEAVRRLESAGIPHADISIVSNDPANRDRLSDAPATTAIGRRSDATGAGATDAATGAGTGASLGAMLGGGAGLLAGLGMLAIPGLGPVVAAGWLASTLVGAGAGAATGGLVGALTGAGIDEADAHTYAEGIRRGEPLSRSGLKKPKQIASSTFSTMRARSMWTIARLPGVKRDGTAAMHRSGVSAPPA